MGLLGHKRFPTVEDVCRAHALSAREDAGDGAAPHCRAADYTAECKTLLTGDQAGLSQSQRRHMPCGERGQAVGAQFAQRRGGVH